MIYINEAHSNKWPIGRPNQPPPQSCLRDRVCNAKKFTEESIPYDLFIDQWDNQYEELFHAWPDKYYFVEKDTLLIKSKSTYGREGERDGKIDVDCTSILTKIINGEKPF